MYLPEGIDKLPSILLAFVGKSLIIFTTLDAFEDFI